MFSDLPSIVLGDDVDWYGLARSWTTSSYEPLTIIDGCTGTLDRTLESGDAGFACMNQCWTDPFGWTNPDLEISAHNGLVSAQWSYHDPGPVLMVDSPDVYGAQSPDSKDGGQSSDAGVSVEGDPRSPAMSDIPLPWYPLDPFDVEMDALSFDALSEHIFHDTVQCGPGIALQDVQQYPDLYSTEDYVNGSPQGHGLVYPLSTELDDASARSLHRDLNRPFNILDDEMGSTSPVTSHDCLSAADKNSGPEEAVAHHPSRSVQSPRHKRSSTCSSRTAAKPSPPDCRVSKASPSSRQPRSKASLVKKNAVSENLNASSTICPHCGDKSASKLALRKHVLAAHRRPFDCTFSFYGCRATFASKNEWKRHVGSQHLRLGIWRCDMGACVPPPPSSPGSCAEAEEREPIYNEFNRKDLFIQHLRRMHSPGPDASDQKEDEFNASLERASRRCLMDIRQPPPRSICGYCSSEGSRTTVFEGPGAWEARMEHVGRHLENGHGQLTTWREDIGLRDWLAQERLIERGEGGCWSFVALQLEEKRSRKGGK